MFVTAVAYADEFRCWTLNIVEPTLSTLHTMLEMRVILPAPKTRVEVIYSYIRNMQSRKNQNNIYKSLERGPFR